MTGAHPRRSRRLRSGVLAGLLVVGLAGCSAHPEVGQGGASTPTAPAPGSSAPVASPSPAAGTPSGYVNSGEGSEQVRTIPVLPTAVRAGKRVVFSEPVTVSGGQILLAVAEFQTTNDLELNVFVASQIVLADRPNAVVGRAVTAANGGNVTPQMHHGQQTKTGTYQVAPSETGPRYVNLVVWAAASQAATGDLLTVDRGYGRLSVVTL